jgi:hypothetical protein
MATKKPGLYANIHAKQERIAHGSGETMRHPGDKGAPAQDDFKKAAKTGKPPAVKKKSAAKKSVPAKKSAARSTTVKSAKERP